MDNKENKWLTNIYKDIFSVEIDELIQSVLAEKQEQNQNVLLTKDDLLLLIDLALLTNDKEWFMELTEKMRSASV